MPLQMLITDAGRDALVDAEAAVTGPIEIATIGLTDTPFVMAPTLTAIPGQFKTLDTVAGQEVAPDVIHMTGYDTSADTYDVTGFGLYLTDGTLFAAYSNAGGPVLSKASLAYGLIAVDILFASDDASLITFSGGLFLYPPASETVQGIARFATQAEVDAVADGPDAYRAVVTDKTLRARLAAFFAVVTAALNAFAARTITGAGAAQGGGDLTANRTITVEQALEADIEGTSNLKVLTPSILGLVRSFTANGRFRLFGFEVKWGSFSAAANGPTTVTFPVAFSGGQCFAAIAWGDRQDATDQDNHVTAIAGSQSSSGFTAYNGHSAMGAAYFAIGT